MCHVMHQWGQVNFLNGTLSWSCGGVVPQSTLITNTPFTLQTEAKRSEPKRSEANRTAESAPFTLAQNAQQCAFHNSLLSTLHTVECASFHTGSEAKRSALLSVVMGSAILVKAIHLVPFLIIKYSQHLSAGHRYIYYIWP